MIKLLTLENSAEWDKVITSFRDHDVYWLSGYAAGFQIHGDGEPILICYEDGGSRAVNVVMKRDIADCHHLKDKMPANTYFDLTTPYGYGGWLMEGECSDKLFEQYDAWCHENGIVCEFVRFHPVIGNHAFVRDRYEVIRLGNVVCMDLGSEETIIQNLTSKNRNMIRKANKNSVKIYHGNLPELYPRFKEVYEATMRNVHAKPYFFFGDEYYRSIYERLKDNAEVFYAEKDGQYVSGSIMLYANGRMNYHLSGTFSEYRTFAPGNLLLYEAAKWGAEKGLKTLYLGGGVGSENDGLYHFKKEFYRGKTLRFHIGKRVVMEDAYQKLAQLSGADDEQSYFPIYRAEKNVVTAETIKL